MTKVGTRVGAMSHGEKGIVYIFGYGTYVGDEVPPDDIMIFGTPISEIKKEWVEGGAFPNLEEAAKNVPSNPKIELDNGKVVWGCECWWGPADEMNRAIGDQKVVEVDIEESRKEATKRKS